MFTVLRNTSVPTSRKPEGEFKRKMTKGKEGYRLEVAETSSLSPPKVCCGFLPLLCFGSSPTTGPLVG